MVCDFAWSTGCSNGGEEASRNHVSELVWIPSDIDRRVRDFSISHSHDLGELFLFACLQGRYLSLKAFYFFEKSSGLLRVLNGDQLELVEMRHHWL